MKCFPSSAAEEKQPIKEEYFSVPKYLSFLRTGIFGSPFMYTESIESTQTAFEQFVSFTLLEAHLQ